MDLIDSRHLPKLTGIPAWKLRDWRHRGLIPRSGMIEQWWVDRLKRVVDDVADGYRLSVAFDRATKREQ